MLVPTIPIDQYLPNSRLYFGQRAIEVKGTDRSRVAGILSIKVGHQLMEKIEHAIKSQVKDCQVQIHAEPIEDPTSWEDNALTNFEKKTPNS